MRRLGRLVGLLTIIMGSILGLYVFIWEDFGGGTGGESHLMSPRHRLVPNSHYLLSHLHPDNTPRKLSQTQPMMTLRKVKDRSDVKAGDRLPQGVVEDEQIDGQTADTGTENGAVFIDEVRRAQQRATQYCNPPEEELTGAEGIAPDGYHLEHVTVLTRHGDRSPMYALPGYEAPWIPCDVNISMARSNPIVTSYLTMMKMTWSKLRPDSPAYRFGLYPHSRYCEGAQMTGLGAIQHIKNGQLLNKAYIEKWGLLAPDFLPHEIKVISTEYTRTYQSAMALMFGFLPVFDLSQIPITFIRSITFCSQKLTGFSCDCMMAYRLEVIVKKEYSKRTKNSTLHSEIKQSIAQVLDVPQSKLPWIAALSDVFNGHTCHNLKLPCSRSDPKSCITWPMIGKVWEFLDYNGVSQLGSYAYQRQQRLLMHPLLHMILHRMHNVTAGVERSKFVLYSGHDKTLTPLATALGIHDGRWPRYASRIVFELYSKGDAKSSQKIYYIRVLFNGKDRTKHVRFCKGKTIDGMCPLSYFQNFVFHEDLQYFGKASYKEACHV